MKDLNKDKDNSNRIEIISCMLATLLYILEAENRHNGSPQDNQKNKKHQALSEQFFELMFRDFRKDRTVKYYAWQMNVSTHYLSRIIYRQTGRTLKDWIADTLMVEIIGRPFLLLHISIHSILQIQNRMHSIQIQERPEPQNTIIRPT